MNDFRDMYEQKKMTPEEAAAFVKDGDTISAPASACEPPILMDAICTHAKESGYKGIRYFKNWQMPTGQQYTKPEFKDIIKPISLFAGGSEIRQMIGEGLADYIPCSLYGQPEIIRHIRPRVLAALASPMDEHGYFTFTCSVVEVQALREAADVVLLEVSPNAPRVLGNNLVHISEVAAICETDSYPAILPTAEPTEEDTKIAGYIAERVNDGDCVQFGIGKVPDAVGELLKSKKHLGIHTEMFGTVMYELVKCGAVDNSMKNTNKGKTIFTLAAGSKELYRYLDNNPACEGHPVDYVNDPYVIAQNDNMVTINACLEVDIFGQVCSESLGPVKISGSGGQLNFARGGNMSKGGRGFIAMHSTAKGGSISKIKPMLTEGSHVTVPMNEVDMIVTEYGVAELRYKPISERAKEMIKIAHPDMREELAHFAKKIGLII